MPSYFGYKTFVDYLALGSLAPVEAMPDGTCLETADRPTLTAFAEQLDEMNKLQKYTIVLNMASNAYGNKARSTAGDTGIIGLDTINIVYEYIWDKHGRYTWRITPAALEFLQHCKMECKTSEFMLPRDVLAMIFPENFHLPKTGMPLRSAFLGRLRSQIAIATAKQLVADIIRDDDSRQVTWYSFDFGEQHSLPEQIIGKKLTLDDYDWHYSGSSPRSYLNIPDNIMFEDFELPPAKFYGSELEADAVLEAAELCAKILWYAKAKPEHIVETKVKSRPHKRHPRKVREVQIPSLYLDTLRHSESQSIGDGKRTVRPHMRGWSLRTLRHERFKRDEHGDPKVILVEPYVVGVKNADDLPEARVKFTDVRAHRS